tara:strand:+ start:326 stop:844 length:519 start_codon:yes stop_codon:yes gene_type:complete
MWWDILKDARLSGKKKGTTGTLDTSKIKIDTKKCKKELIEIAKRVDAMSNGFAYLDDIERLSEEECCKALSNLRAFDKSQIHIASDFNFTPPIKLRNTEDIADTTLSIEAGILAPNPDSSTNFFYMGLVGRRKNVYIIGASKDVTITSMQSFGKERREEMLRDKFMKEVSWK